MAIGESGQYSDASGEFDKAPLFNVNDKLKFDTDNVDNANEHYGSSSGFFGSLSS